METTMKKAHIISHTHRDREWYLPYEKHHMLYIEMMDTLIDTMEKIKNINVFIWMGRPSCWKIIFRYGPKTVHVCRS